MHFVPSSFFLNFSCTSPSFALPFLMYHIPFLFLLSLYSLPPPSFLLSLICLPVLNLHLPSPLPFFLILPHSLPLLFFRSLFLTTPFISFLSSSTSFTSLPFFFPHHLPIPPIPSLPSLIFLFLFFPSSSLIPLLSLIFTSPPPFICSTAHGNTSEATRPKGCCCSKETLCILKVRELV